MKAVNGTKCLCRPQTSLAVTLGLHSGELQSVGGEKHEVFNQPWRISVGALSEVHILCQCFPSPGKCLKDQNQAIPSAGIPDALSLCLTTLASSCPLWSVLWAGQRSQGGQMHPGPPSHSPLKCQNTFLPHRICAVYPSSCICFAPLGSGASVFHAHFE